MKTLVLDTNILVGACKGSKQSNLLIAECLKGTYQPLIGIGLFIEYEDVLNRDDLFLDCNLNRAERNELLDALLSVCRWVKVYYRWRPNLKDEADNHVLELAIAGNADYLVTHNLKDFRNGEILFPHLCICQPEILLGEQS